jgi:hypothetical protein
MVMLLRGAILAVLCVFLAEARDSKPPRFQTSDRCVACHNGLTTASGRDVSIGFEWQASIMANSSRDPYWQASVRRETIDHAVVKGHIEDECSVCHMPVTRYLAHEKGREGEVFSHLPFDPKTDEGREARDGVDCSVCHQISKEKLGTRDSFNGGFVLEPLESPGVRPEYGPFDIPKGQQRIMRTSTAGFQPSENTDHIRKSELCATCHTLFTTAFAPDGTAIGSLPEQMPYPEWLNSDYRTTKTCQDCHMTQVGEQVAITRVFGVPRDGMKRHVFVAANFFMTRMLNRYRSDLQVTATPEQLSNAADYIVEYLKSQAARISIENVQSGGGRVRADVMVENLGGHKLPTAYPSRRAWVRLVVRDKDGRAIFESGALNPNGSIVGNDNDADAHKYEPHYQEITSADQVEIFEDILGDQKGQVTTGLLTGVRYLKDNRLLPHGFDKRNAKPEVAVIGGAADDPNFTGAGARVRYSVNTQNAQGPFQIEAELWYQPIGYRWANNLKTYDKLAEPARFNTFYDSMSDATAVVLARASVAR